MQTSLLIDPMTKIAVCGMKLIYYKGHVIRVQKLIINGPFVTCV